MKNVQKGFTLIELMIVVAIIAILAAIAIPQYQSYITKSQFSESQTIADGLKTPIVEYFNQTGSCPAVGGANGTNGSLASNILSYSGKYVKSATVAPNAAKTGCEISVLFKASPSVSTPLNGATVIIAGTDNGGSFSWLCDQGNASKIPTKYEPTACVGN
ncbi:MULTISPECIES: pilin [unclassified Dyella]|uniref:pilin n=1 Tax=unclassified Dyella TaxID=2634549 RepID=UPI000C848FBB|nr:MULTISPECIES: pilin [unclassified Dyella]MDR3444764.1 pilin [Dyella sp.]PMQ06865.1 Fimbrial protein [Dyella sp. AD56]